MNTVHFTKDKAEALRKAYDKAIKDKQDRFIFGDNTYWTPYAKYLLEYLDDKFKDLK